MHSEIKVEIAVTNIAEQRDNGWIESNCAQQRSQSGAGRKLRYTGWVMYSNVWKLPSDIWYNLEIEKINLGVNLIK